MNPRFHSGRANTTPTSRMQSTYPNGSADPPDSPSLYIVPAAPWIDSAPNQVAKMENDATPRPRVRPARM